MENQFVVEEIDLDGAVWRRVGFMFENEARAAANLSSQQREDRAYWVKTWHGKHIAGYGMNRLGDAAIANLSGSMSEDRCI